MWRTVAEWILRTLELVEGQRKQQAKIIEVEKRVRDLEEAFRILSLETRHARDLEATERDKLLLRMEHLRESVRLAAPEPESRTRKKLR